MSELKDISFKSNQLDKNKEKRIYKKEQSLWEIWYYVNWLSIQLIGIPEREETVSNLENIVDDIIQENFPILLER